MQSLTNYSNPSYESQTEQIYVNIPDTVSIAQNVTEIIPRSVFGMNNSMADSITIEYLPSSIENGVSGTNLWFPNNLISIFGREDVLAFILLSTLFFGFFILLKFSNLSQITNIKSFKVIDISIITLSILNIIILSSSIFSDGSTDLSRIYKENKWQVLLALFCNLLFLGLTISDFITNSHLLDREYAFFAGLTIFLIYFSYFLLINSRGSSLCIFCTVGWFLILMLIFTLSALSRKE
jgi:hypothetical protein